MQGGVKFLKRAAAAIILIALSSAVFAAEREEPVALIADQIEYDADTGVVRASGAVEVYYRGQTLTADVITYDSRADRVTAEGDIVLRTDRGETVFADMAALDADLRAGVVEGAQSVIAGNGKIAAVEARRIDGRYNVLEKAVFSPCEVCAANPVPLWRIRAERIIHDQEAQEIHYEDAYFDFAGVTVGFLPYFRHPSPEVERATGFLAPQITRDRGYGLAVKAPYYFVIGDHSDLTLTPFLSTGDGALATFDDPEQAVAAAQDLIADLRGDGVELRVGLHFGKVEILGDDVAGVGVHLAARISGLAQPGEVLVSRTVRDLLLGSDLTFTDRGTHELKGVPDQWEVLAVTSG